VENPRRAAQPSVRFPALAPPWSLPALRPQLKIYSGPPPSSRSPARASRWRCWPICRGTITGWPHACPACRRWGDL